MSVFLDIEGAFNRVCPDVVIRAANRFGLHLILVRWLSDMLRERYLEAELQGYSVFALVTNGCPQGGVISPLIWCLVVDSLLTELNN